MRRVKVVLCGDGGVGKTSLARVFTGSRFNPLQRLTVGVAHYVREVPASDGALTFVIWDLGGEERFRFLAPIFLRGAEGAVFVFDVTRDETFADLDDWLEVMLNTIGDVPRVLVGNKVDLEELRVVPRDVAERYAERRGFLAYFETSAKAGINVDKPFLKLAEALAARRHGD
ncbi:MAG: hypothetical protein DRK00_05685 [Thermoprotei archaeon]|nr:MAG: hypothetical protein DRK00_05685 [Thermoprotei archaeon]